MLMIGISICLVGEPTKPIRGPKATPSQQPHPTPPIWVGSPVDGRWGTAGLPGSTPAGRHHTLGKASPRNQWAVDVPSGRGTAVNLYVGSPSQDAAITTAVTQIVDNDACLAGGGGDFVTIGIYYDGRIVGRVTYAHLDRSPALRVGTSVARWGTTLGTVASLQGDATGGSNCWTGPHVHIELGAAGAAACWIGDYRPGSPLDRADPLGYISGPVGEFANPCAG